MRHPLLDAAEQKYQRPNALSFEIGDTVAVTTRIIEGDKERSQDFTGTVIARRGHGTSETFIVRRLVGNEGVERCFPLHSPKVSSVKVVRSGKVRRCKLYFLRERVGKARKLRERRISAEARKAASEARAAKANAVAEAAQVVESSRGEAAMATT